LDLTDGFISEDNMALVNTEFERQEEYWDRSLGVSADLYVLVLAVEGIGSLLDTFFALLGSKHRLLVFSIFGSVGNFTSGLLSFGTSSSLNLLSSKLFAASSSLV
jgi:hypothetical protein